MLASYMEYGVIPYGVGIDLILVVSEFRVPVGGLMSQR